MANPVAANYQGPVAKNQTGYNGVTGAAAKWNEDEGYWIDANGERIRDDAIVPTAPATSGVPQGGAQPAAPPAAPGAPPPPGGAPGGAGGMNGSAFSGLTPQGAGQGPQQASIAQPPTAFDFGQPVHANPALGQSQGAFQNLVQMIRRRGY